MAELVSPDVIVYVCRNCIPTDGRLPRQWKQGGVHVVVREVPCSGKMDAQYLLHAFEGGGQGICVVACPKGECQLVQGNYRAEIRVGMVRKLLGEIGLEAGRAEFVHCSPQQPFRRWDCCVREAVGRLCALGPSAIRKQPQEPTDQGQHRNAAAASPTALG